MIQDVDQSTVLGNGVIDSPVLGKIPPVGLSGGVNTLILVKFEQDKIFNASTCGDNCAKWLLRWNWYVIRNVLFWKAPYGKGNWRKFQTALCLLMKGMHLLRQKSSPGRFRKQIIIM